MKAFWIILVIIVIVIVLVGLNQKTFKGAKTTLKDNPYQRMRDMIFSLTYDSINLSDKKEVKPIFALMELDISGDIATVVNVADGSTSLYLSTGGAIIGGGTHESVRKASDRFLAQANDSIEFMTKDENHIPPSEGEVCFFVKNTDGVFRYCSREKDLEEGKDKLSQLYILGHNVITELRKISPQ